MNVWTASLAIVWLGASAVTAAEPSQTAAGASGCAGCHAPAQLGSAVPPLLGRSAEEITRAMQDFRSGARQATVMDRIAKGFSDEETRAIAIWLAAQR